MEHIYRWLGSDEQAKKLWQNKESLEKYIDRLRDFWDEENECWLDAPNNVADGNKKASLRTGQPK